MAATFISMAPGPTPGTMAADSSSTVYLGGSFSLGTGSSFGGTGVFYLTGTLANTGSTLSIDSSELAFALEGGMISGGTIDVTGGAVLAAYSGTLEGVTLDGTLDMTGYYSSVTVTDGLTLDGTIDLGSTIYYNNIGYYYGDLDFQGAQTLSGTGSVVFGNSSNNAINTASVNGDLGTLTIGSGITIDGDTGSIGYDNDTNQTPLVVEGTVASDGGGSISIYGSGWTNSGTLAANNDGTLPAFGTWSNDGLVQAVDGGTFSSSTSSNLSSGILSGGNWFVGADSTLNLEGSISELAATLTLQGSGTSFSGLSSLVTIDSTGDLILQGGASLSLSGSLDNSGTIDLRRAP